jgi:hypothetical protein
MGSHPILIGVACLIEVRAASVFLDYVLRDPMDFDRAPKRVAKASGLVLVGAPFLLLLLNLQSRAGVFFPASVSLACSSVMVPATFGARTDDSILGWQGRIERALLTLGLASVVVVLSSVFESAWWYLILFLIGYLGLNSRLLIVSLSVQNNERTPAENDERVRLVRRFHNMASRAYCVLAILLGALVAATGLGVQTWNTGGAVIRSFVYKVWERMASP